MSSGTRPLGLVSEAGELAKDLLNGTNEGREEFGWDDGPRPLPAPSALRPSLVRWTMRQTVVWLTPNLTATSACV